MKPVNKLELLTQLELQVESHLAEAIKFFQNLHEDILLRPSSTGGWSIAQCLEHLNRYSDYYHPEIAKRLKQHPVSNNNVFKSTWLGSYFTRLLNPATGKKKIKAFKDYIPDASLDAHAVVREFIKRQEDLLMLLREARHADLNKIRVPVSIARFIKLRLGDVFQFLIVHNERHMLQAKRNLTVDVDQL